MLNGPPQKGGFFVAKNMGEIPIKYKELRRALHSKVAPMPTSGLTTAFENVANNRYTARDVAVIERDVYLSHWGMETDSEEATAFSIEEVETAEDMEFAPQASQTEIDRRNAQLYRKLLKRVFNGGARLQRSNAKEYDQYWVSLIDGEPMEMHINEEIILALGDMANRVRMELYDAGHQQMVNKIHSDLSISFTEDGNLQKTVII